LKDLGKSNPLVQSNLLMNGLVGDFKQFIQDFEENEKDL
jgi:hypothetical protein